MNILFISHDAYPAGAQKLLLHLIRWIKENKKDILFHTLLLGEGQLVEEFETVSDRTYTLPRRKKHSRFRFLPHVSIKKDSKSLVEDQLFNDLEAIGYDLVYANSVASMKMSIELKQKLDCPLVLHVHELESVIKDRVPDFDILSPRVDLFIAASNLVKENLEKNHQIPSSRIKVIYEFSTAKTSINSQKGPDDEIIIGGSGSLSYRKGIDIFIQTAILFKKRFPVQKVLFRWVGGAGKSLRDAQQEVDKAGVSDLIEIIEMVDNPIDHFNRFDVFLMTSREDPFPLVCIEAGQLGKPIICFKGVTGTEEIVKQGGGHVVPYLDLIDLTDRLHDYASDPGKIANDGIHAKELFSEFTPDKICPQIIEVINQVVVK